MRSSWSLDPDAWISEASTQLVLLTPGTYHFQGKYQVDLVSQRGLQWHVICAGGAQDLNW